MAITLAGMIALAGSVLGRIYADDLVAVLVAGAAIGAVGISLATRRLPSWTAAPISVLLLAAYTVFAVRTAASRADLTDPLPHLLADAVANGIPRLLTAMIPVESTPDTVVVPVVAAWLAGLAGAEAAVRSGRALLGCAPPAALYAGALYVVGPNADAAGRLTLLFTGLVVVALFVSTDRRREPQPGGGSGRGRKLVGAAAGLIVGAGLIAVVAPWVGDRVGTTPVDPRKYVEPPQVDSLDESPLNRISGWALTPNQKLLQVTVPPGTGSPPRLRLAVLSDYDGVTWRVGATYRNAGRVLPPEPLLPDADVRSVREDVTVDGLTGRLLPVVPTPTRVDGARVAFDPSTGTLIRPEGLAPGVRYTVTSQVQTPDENLLSTADTPSGDAVARYLRLGAGVPDPIQKLADTLAEGNAGGYDRAAAIEDFLAAHYRSVPDAPSGHAYPNLQFFLFGPRDQGGQRGTSEQFAASFALLARLTGLPSRVVVGFTVPKGGGTVTAADALAWPEVLFDDLGWVAFDPMPKDDHPTPVEEDFTPKPSPPPSPSDDPTPPTPDASTPAPAAVLAAGSGGGAAGVVAGGAGGSVLLLLLAAAGVVLMMRRSLSRRRLATGGPDARIAGAWHEFTDALRLAGRPVPRHLAATEAAAFAGALPPAVRGPAGLRRAAPKSETPAPDTRPQDRAAGAEEVGAEGTGADQSGAETPMTDRAAGAGEVVALPPLDELVAGVNASAFAPGATDAAQAERAGAQAVAYAEALRSRRPWWRRLWWSLNPGPLRW